MALDVAGTEGHENRGPEGNLSGEDLLLVNNWVANLATLASFPGLGVVRLDNTTAGPEPVLAQTGTDWGA